jgi:hypothetical protein
VPCKNRIELYNNRIHPKKNKPLQLPKTESQTNQAYSSEYHPKTGSKAKPKIRIINKEPLLIYSRTPKPIKYPQAHHYHYITQRNSLPNPHTFNHLKNTLQLLYKVACISQKKCYFCTRIRAQVHTNTGIPPHKKGLEII